MKEVKEEEEEEAGRWREDRKEGKREEEEINPKGGDQIGRLSCS